MESLILEGTKETPTVNFNTNGTLSIKGISTPSNINHFYQPLFDWIENLKNLKPNHVNIEFMMDYINTSSSRIIVDMIRLIQSLKTEGIKVSFSWLYEDDDEDMLELGEDFQIVTKANFDFKAVEA